MKKLLPVILSAILAALLFVGCNQTVTDPADTTDPVETPETPVTTEKEKETKAPETEPLVTGPVEPNGDFELVISEPNVVYQSKQDVQGWGKHQFPFIGYTADGLIRISWQYGEDKVGAQNTTYRRVSMNGGKSWIPGTSIDNVVTRVPMQNGKELTGFLSKGTTYNLSFDKYTPVFTAEKGLGSASFYLLSDLQEDPTMMDAWVFGIQERDPETGATKTVDATIHWPWATVGHYPNGSTYTVSGKIGQDGKRFLSAADGTLYTCFYTPSLDSSAATLEEAKDCLYQYCSTFVLYSKDFGRNWYVAKQFIPTEETMAMSVDYQEHKSDYEGFTEPYMIETPSGGFFILMRTGGTRTLFWSYSEDGMTWSDPLPFDDFGVLPELLTLDCGVTVASYGRPELRLRATSDPTCQTWQDSVTIPVTSKDPDPYARSCFYTGMIQLDANTAMLVYSDFRYPNKDGLGVRTILTRKIHVVPKTAAAAAE